MTEIQNPMTRVNPNAAAMDKRTWRPGASSGSGAAKVAQHLCVNRVRGGAWCRGYWHCRRLPRKVPGRHLRRL